MEQTSVTKGYLAETYAVQFLIKQGLKCLARNYGCRLGEIDLIMQSPCGTLVFVEVRRRRSAQFGGALQSVTRQKQQKIMKAANYYLMQHPKMGHQGIRFDVLALDGVPPKINWVKQAFEE